MGQSRPFLRRRGRGDAPHPHRKGPPERRGSHGGGRTAHCRSRRSSARRHQPEDELLALHEALDAVGRRLIRAAPSWSSCAISPVLTMTEAAEVLGISARNSERNWPFAASPACTEATMATSTSEDGSPIQILKMPFSWRFLISSHGKAIAPMNGRNDMIVAPERSGRHLHRARTRDRRTASAYLDEACGPDASFAPKSRNCLRACTKRPALFLMRRPGRPGPPSRSRSPTERPGTRHRPLQAPGANRRRRHGHRLHGRATRSPSAAKSP